MVALNVTSLGYAGSITEVSGARYFNFLGASRFGVLAPDHLQVTVTTGDRMVRVLSGTAWGNNIVDEVHSAATIQLDAVASGSRWDAVVLRRDPATATTSLEFIKGTSQKVIPTLHGLTHMDQPLALVRVQAGQTTPQEIEDLRVWAGPGGMTANSLMVRNYMNQPGTTLEVNGTMWVRRLTTGGAVEWVATGGEVSVHPLSVEANFTAVGGVSVTRMPNGWRRVDLAVSIRRTTRDGWYPNDAKWREMGTFAIPSAARGNAIGSSQDTIQINSPIYFYNSRNTEPQEGTLAWRVVPRTGEILFGLPMPDAYGSSTWAWRVDEQSNINLSYLVQ